MLLHIQRTGTILPALALQKEVATISKTRRQGCAQCILCVYVPYTRAEELKNTVCAGKKSQRAIADYETDKISVKAKALLRSVQAWALKGRSESSVR